MPVLEVRGLCASLSTPRGPVRAVDGIDFRVEAGRTLGIVGESGCGKTLTALSLLRLLPPTARVTGGSVRLDGRELLHLNERAMRAVRGGAIAMVFQEPMTSLNPVLTVGEQIAEAVRLHERASRRAARARAVEMLRRVEIPAPESRVNAYPHELSGGTRQRVMIAMALACRPRVLVADEPTTALDVTIEAAILDLLAVLQADSGMALILVTHDLGVIAERADEVLVMYAGRAVELASVPALFANPLHPYTRGLLRAIPGLEPAPARRLEVVPGLVPELDALPSGCPFRDRCPQAVDRCAIEELALGVRGPHHRVACLRVEEGTA
ncbi:ABC transporter ATP-binding protein [Candidatus Binatia bacterium]|nr:ABC transporter ATP-binding protein [Candidatus Binatia bacterium]